LMPLLLTLSSTAVSAYVTQNHYPHRRTVPWTTTTTRFSASQVDQDNSKNKAEEQADTAAEMVTAALEEAAFLEQCKMLCQERNLPLQNVKNARDLSTIQGSPVLPGRLFRTGRVSDASTEDIALLLEDLNMTTLVDLRSPTELKDDATLMRTAIYGNFTNLLWRERKPGCVLELEPNQVPLKKHFWNRKYKKGTTTEASGVDPEDETVTTQELLEKGLQDDDELLISTNHEQNGDCLCQDPSQLERPSQDRRERHFVSLMNELKYVKGTVSKVRKRDMAKSLLKAPGALVSQRVRNSCKKPFLDEINQGGLPMVNDMLLRYGAPGIKYVLELACDRHRHPMAFYCTAGKDRTGVITALILKLCGVSTQAIVEDYTLSANVYAEMNDHQAMVGALSQRSLDPKTFLGAPAHVMQDTLDAMEEEYGSVEAYLEWIGFDKTKQEALKKACMEE